MFNKQKVDVFESATFDYKQQETGDHAQHCVKVSLSAGPGSSLEVLLVPGGNVPGLLPTMTLRPLASYWFLTTGTQACADSPLSDSASSSQGPSRPSRFCPPSVSESAFRHS